MDRRIAIKNLALIIGGTLVLPACDRKANQTSIALKKINLSADNEALIADIAETIIPKTDTPGARDLQLHQFVMKMLDDCYTKEDQEAYVSGLKEFEKLVEKENHTVFSALSPAQREQWLAKFDQQKIAESPLTKFYGTTKQLTVFGYTNSKFFMTKEIIYELVPGRYNPKFPVSQIKKHPRYA